MDAGACVVDWLAGAFVGRSLASAPDQRLGAHPPTYLRPSLTQHPYNNTHTDRSAITALTAQNSHEVRAVQTSSLPQLRTTLEALGDDFPPQAVKLGMLATAEVKEEWG